MIIHLLPITHDVQLGHHILSTKYKNSLKKLIEDLRIDLVCEELSEDGAKSKHHDYIAMNVAKELEISYLFCDPPDDEREVLGILSPKEISDKLDAILNEARESRMHPEELFSSFRQEMTTQHNKREKHWLKHLRGRDSKNTLFIVGLGHLSFYEGVYGEGFDKLLDSEGFETKIISTDFVDPIHL